MEAAAMAWTNGITVDASVIEEGVVMILVWIKR